MPLLRLEATRNATVELQPDARADPLVAVARPDTRSDDSLDARLAVLGLRSLSDLLAPPSLVIGEDYLALDGQYVRVLAVADLPPFVAAGWLSGVLAEKLAVDVSLHVRPLDAGAAAGGLTLKSWRLGGALNDDRANGRPEDNHLTTAYEQIEHLRRGLARRETALFSVGLYLQLRASSRAELEALTKRGRGPVQPPEWGLAGAAIAAGARLSGLLAGGAGPPRDPAHPGYRLAVDHLPVCAGLATHARRHHVRGRPADARPGGAGPVRPPCLSERQRRDLRSVRRRKDLLHQGPRTATCC